VEILFREIEEGESVLVHELDDLADFLKFHGEKRVRLNRERVRDRHCGRLGS
jgi:hypothetical protein